MHLHLCSLMCGRALSATHSHRILHKTLKGAIRDTEPNIFQLSKCYWAWCSLKPCWLKWGSASSSVIQSWLHMATRGISLWNAHCTALFTDTASLQTNQHLQAQIPLRWAVDFWFIWLKVCSLITSSSIQMDIFVILMLAEIEELVLEILMRPYWDPANAAPINAHNPPSLSRVLRRGSNIMLLLSSTIELVGRRIIFLFSLFGRILLD